MNTVAAETAALRAISATASARLRQLGVTAPGATIALAGGVVASAALSTSGLLVWTLSRSDVSANTALVRAISTLSVMMPMVAADIPPIPSQLLPDHRGVLRAVGRV